jgi:DNA-binding PadR family transcriptional regulator
MTKKRRTSKEPQVDPSSPLAPVVAEVRSQIRTLEQSIPDDPNEDDEGTRHVRSRIEGMDSVLTLIQRAGASGVVENGQRLVKVADAPVAVAEPAPKGRTLEERVAMIEFWAQTQPGFSWMTSARSVDRSRVRPVTSLLEPVHERPAKVRAPAPVPRPEPESDADEEPDADGDMAKMDRAILGVLLHRQGPTTNVHIAILSGYARSGTFVKALARLRAAGLISTTRGDNRITERGIDEIPRDHAPNRAGSELISFWVGKLRAMDAAILKAVCDAEPRGLTRAELLTRSGYSNSGTFVKALARLKRAELITKGWPKRGNEIFFEGNRG